MHTRVKVKTLTLWRGLLLVYVCNGVWRYQDSINEVFSPRFFIVNINTFRTKKI